MGLPEWQRVEGWLSNCCPPKEKVPDPEPTWKRKHPDIPPLEDYGKLPDDSFWKLFPSNYPNSVYTPVDVGKLESYISECAWDWTESEKLVAKKAVQRVKGEVLVQFTKALPSLNEKNAESAIKNGEQMTDTLADWIRKGFVAGPYDGPPLKKF